MSRDVSDEALWMKRLARASEYWELQEIFARMAAAARDARDPAALATAIDEAIERIRRERARDEEELAEYEREYAAFRGRESGVVGWLKRHLPFTETRAEEKRHKAEVLDQQAEILADNLTIARAQILKQTLLPAAERALGHAVEHWSQRLEETAAGRPRAFAETLAALRREAARGEAFVAAVEAEVEAFAGARFTTDKDRAQQRVDLKAARAEVAPLRKALGDERELDREGVTRLRTLVVGDLEHTDRRWRSLTRRSEQLGVALERAESVAQRLGEAHAAMHEMQERAEALERVPTRLRELDAARARVRERVATADRRRLHAATVASEHEARESLAREALQQAEGALLKARSAHDAHVRARGQGELAEGVAFEHSSAQAAALVRAERALEDARGAHRIAAAPFDSARRERAQAEHELKAAGEEDARLAADAASLAAEEQDRARALAEAGEALRPLLERTPAAVAAYLEVIAVLDHHSSFQDEADSFVRRPAFGGAGFDNDALVVRDFESALERLARLRTTARSEQDALEEEQIEARRHLDETFVRHGRSVLGEDLFAEFLG